ncbi:MAG TPA: glycosyltransferase family 2 protein [Anaerolineales bacterium]|nr:glycosyltransferase family 2 protein [Anaerolineales bacterium]
MFDDIDLSVVIVSWNVRALLKNSLASLLKAVQGYQAEIFVVDNASRDGSVEMVASDFPEVHLIANHENLGFGAANNQALKLCRGRYILLLNPDTVVPETAIRRMIRFLKKRSKAGLVGPEQIDGKGRLLLNWVRFNPREMGEYVVENLVALFKGRYRILFRRPRRVPILNAACWLARREVLAKTGFFDDDLFMYAEEPDMCSRIRRAGWEIWLLREVHIIHYKRQSIRQRGLLTELKFFFSSMYIWLRKRWQQEI